jgi:ubiquinone biosynthesis protein COQ9
MDETTTTDQDRRRDDLLLATLPHVAFEGWTQRAIAAGLADSGLSEADGELAFPGGTAEMIAHWQSWSDRRTFDAVDGAAIDGLTTAERLAMAARARIEVNIPYREAVRRTLAFLALPANAATALRLSWQTVDALWYAAGDTTTDFRYYGRRAALAAIYAATVFYWLDDDSEDFAATWAFLDRRLGDDAVAGFRPRLQAVGAAARPLLASAPGITAE